MTRDMTTGSIPKHMLVYAVPLLFGNIFQQLYHTVDSVVVGKYNGKESLAAIGAAGPIMNILLFIIVGLSMGASILMAEQFGAKDYPRLRRELSTSLIAGVAFTLVISIISVFAAPLFLIWTNTPSDILEESTRYLRIVCAGMLFSCIYNVFAAALRSVGDSRTPLLVLIMTSLLNIVLDVWFVGYLGFGLEGAAWATIFSQAISSIVLTLYVHIKVPLLRLSKETLKIDFSLLKTTTSYGTTSAVQQTVVYLGRVLVQSAVNSLGVDSMAAFNAAFNLDSFAVSPGDALAASVTTIVAQNRGAKKYDRVPKGFHSGLIIGIFYTLFIAAVVYCFPEVLMGLFLNGGEINIIQMGSSYLRSMAVFYLATAFTQTMQGLFRGLGHLNVTLLGSLIQIGIRVLITYLMIHTLGINAVAIGTGIGWLCMIVYETIVWVRYKRRELFPQENSEENEEKSEENFKA